MVLAMLKDAGEIEELYVKQQNSNNANVLWLGETFLEFWCFNIQPLQVPLDMSLEQCPKIPTLIIS